MVIFNSYLKLPEGSLPFVSALFFSFQILWRAIPEAHGRDDEVERRIGPLEMELGEMTTFFNEIDTTTPIQNLFWLVVNSG